jgi:outer membrane protein
MTHFQRALALALLVPSLASANELSRIYQLAVRNDTQLQAAKGARDSVLATNPQARGALLPQVNGIGSYASQEDEITSENVDPLTPGEETATAKSEPYNLTLRISQTLFDAAAWNRWQQADANSAAAWATYRLAEQNLAVRVSEAYFNLLGAADNVRFADAEKKAIERQLELAKKRFEVGLSAITDVQEAQARYDLTVAQMIEAEQALVTAQVAVSEITGAADAAVVPLKDEIPLLGPNPDSINDWLKTASEKSLEIRLATAQVRAASEDVDVRRAGHYPTLNAVGSQSVGESSGFNTGEYDQSKIGLELSVPIFAGGSTQAGVNSAKGTLEQRRAELEGKKRAVERNTRTAYQGVIAGVSRVKAYNQAVVSNKTALEASEVGLEVGARTAVDVLNAQRELYRAQRDYSKSRYDYLLSILRLKQSAGQLAAKDLNEIDALLGAQQGSAVARSPAN